MTDTASTTETTEDLQRALAESSATAAQARAELDRRAATAAAAAKAEEQAADRALLADAKAVDAALEQRGRDAETAAAAGVRDADLDAAWLGFAGWLGSRQARQYHRDDVRAAAVRLGRPDPYPTDLRQVQMTFWDFLEGHVGEATNRAALDHLEALGVEH